jgi:hypothetical protein
MIDNCVCFQDYIIELGIAQIELEIAQEKIEILRASLNLILNANSLPYAQEIAAKALEEKKK